MTIPSLLKRNCGLIYNLLLSSNELTVVHHWDTDGIASAAIIGRVRSKLGRTDFIVPKIGNYTLNAFSVNPKSSLLVLDYGLKLSDVLKLKRDKGVKALIIDHHVNTIEGCEEVIVCNPLLFSMPEHKYPSTTWVIKKLLNIEGYDDLVALGMVGDVSNYIKDDDIRTWLSRLRYDVNYLIKISELIDSCYKAVDYGCIHHARELLTKCKDFEEVINDELLKNRLEVVNNEINELMNSIEPKSIDLGGHNIKIVEVESKYYITSSIGRGLARKYSKSIVVLINKVRRLGRSYVYVRSYYVNLRTVLNKLRKQGLKVGGKDMVFVVTCNELSCSKELNYVLNALEELRSS